MVSLQKRLRELPHRLDARFVHQRGLDVVSLRTRDAASLRRTLDTVLVSDSRRCIDSPCVSFFQTHRESLLCPYTGELSLLPPQRGSGDS